MCTFLASAWYAARMVGVMEGVLLVPISQCRGYCARISSGVRSGAGLVDSKSMEGVSGSAAIASLREGWDGSGE